MRSEGSAEDAVERLSVKVGVGATQDKKRDIVRTIHHILKVRQPELARQQFRDRSL